MKILITGVCGYLGFELTKILSNHEIIGIDLRNKINGFHSNVLFYKMSILDPKLEEIFFKHNPDICIHLAWSVTPVHNDKLAYEVDYEGTKTIFFLCKTFKVKHIVFMSSTLAYGALKNNKKPLTEQDPLRAKNTFHYSYHKRLVENEIIQPFVKDNPTINVTILRPAGFLGPTVHNYVSNILRAKILPVMIGGRNTEIQFLHIEDLLNVINLVLEENIYGVYNVTPDDSIVMKDVPNYLLGYKVYVPEFLARLTIKIAWFFRIYKAPSSYLDFVRFEFIASNEKLKKKTGWRPIYSTTEAIESLIEYKKS